MSAPPARRICVLLGAGASYDVWNGVGYGYGPREELRPPLTSQLFDPRFLDVLQRYPGARVLAQELAPLAQAGALNVEEKLSEYRNSNDPRVRAHYSEIPAYLRDIIFETCRGHRQTPGCLTQVVKLLMADQPHQVLFLTTNYDDLIEAALQAFDPALSFQTLDDYVAASRQAWVVKVHGSIDWFVPLAPSSGFDSWRDAAHASDLRFDENAVRRIPGREQSCERCTIPEWFEGAAGWMYPYVTAPEAQKGGSEAFRCPKSHTTVASEFIGDCSRFLIIGSSGLDSDVIDFLRSHIREEARVHVVGGPDAYEAAIRFGKSIRWFGSLGDVGTVYKDGFRKYAASEELNTLVTP